MDWGTVAAARGLGEQLRELEDKYSRLVADWNQCQVEYQSDLDEMKRLEARVAELEERLAQYEPSNPKL